MGVKGDKMADALEAYRGSWTLTLTNATGTTRLQLVVGARGSTKISGNVTDVSVAGKLSGKFVDDAGANWTLSAPAFDEFDPAAPSYSASVLCKSGKLVATNTIELLARDLEGDEYGVISGYDPAWTAWQSPWANEPWKSMAKQFARQQLDPISDGAGGTITLKLTATGAVSAKLATTATNPRTGATIAYTATCSSTLVPLGGDEYKVFVHFPPKATATVDFPGCSLAIPITP